MSSCCPSIDYETLLVYVEQIISRKLLCGELQGGLLCCASDTVLPRGTRMVTCGELDGLVQEAIDDGSITLPDAGGVTLEDCVLTFTDHNGNEHSVNLAPICDRILVSAMINSDNELVLTRGNGETITTSLAQFGVDSIELEDGTFRLTRADGTSETADLTPLKVTSVALTDDNRLILTFGNGSTTEVDLTSLRGICTDESLAGAGTDCEDRMGVDTAWLRDTINQMLEDGELLCTDSSMTGTGADEDCLGVDTAWLRDTISQMLTEGELLETDDSLTGTGGDGDPLGVDEDWLNNHIQDAMDDGTINARVEVDTDTCLRGDGTPQNPLSISIACLADELFEPARSSFYVDALGGNSNNSGTPGSPVRTIAEAIALMESPVGAYRIYLHAGQNHYLDSIIQAGQRTLDIRYYNDPVYPISTPPGEPLYRPWFAEELTRPHIVSRRFVTEAGLGRVGLIEGAQLTVRGCVIRSEVDQDLSPGGSRQVLVATGRVSLFGCELRLDNDYMNGLCSAVECRGERNIIELGDASLPLIHNFSAITSLSDVVAGIEEEADGLPSYTALPGYTLRALPLTRLFSVLHHDPATKTQFSFTTQWDPY